MTAAGERHPIEGRGLQDRIDTGLSALAKLAASEGNRIDMARLSSRDLFTLADMPLTFSPAGFYQHAFDLEQGRTLRRLLDRVSVPSITLARAAA